MKPFPSSTLIITTYNWVSALELVLLSVKNQSILPNEVIIADDGSTEETKALIATFQENFPTKLIHVWHEDKGFRLAEIRNKAICKATSDYIIQVDGDIILHQHFVKNHLQVAQENTFLTGSRVLLNDEVTKKAQAQKKTHFSWFSKGIKNRMNAVYFPLLRGFLTAPTTNIQKAVTNVRGCNMSFWKKDLQFVNGYDESMTGWGREDSEISVRLVNAGKTKRRIKFGGIQFHQYHKESSRSGLNKNDEILAQTIQQKKTCCESGLSNHC